MKTSQPKPDRRPMYITHTKTTAVVVYRYCTTFLLVGGSFVPKVLLPESRISNCERRPSKASSFSDRRYIAREPLKRSDLRAFTSETGLRNVSEYLHCSLYHTVVVLYVLHHSDYDNKVRAFMHTP